MAVIPCCIRLQCRCDQARHFPVVPAVLKARQMRRLQPLPIFRPAEVMTNWLIKNAAAIFATITSLRRHPLPVLAAVLALLVVTCAIIVTQ